MEPQGYEIAFSHCKLSTSATAIKTDHSLPCRNVIPKASALCKTVHALSYNGLLFFSGYLSHEHSAGFANRNERTRSHPPPVIFWAGREGELRATWIRNGSFSLPTVNKRNCQQIDHSPPCEKRHYKSSWPHVNPCTHYHTMACSF